jgi:hypothetical protein
LGAAWVIALGSRHAAAQNSQTAPAEDLYRQGQALLESGKVDEACTRFSQSYDMDAVAPTLFALASCHDKAGKVASAWSEYRRFLQSGDKDSTRVKTAQERADALQTKLPRVSMRMSDEPTDLTVRLDGATIRLDAYKTPLPIDPGSHVLQLSAPGHRDREQRFDIKAGEQKELEIPSMARGTPGQNDSKNDESPGIGQRVAGFVLLGFGVIGAGVTTGLAVAWRSAVSKSEERYPCTPVADVPSNTAGYLESECIDSVYGTYSKNPDSHTVRASEGRTLFLVAGGVSIGLLATGTLLVLTAPSSGPPKGAKAISPRHPVGLAGPRPSLQVGPGSLQLSGTFW